MALFEFSPEQFLAEIPEMRAFPQLSSVYRAWQTECESRGNVSFSLKTEVVSVDRSYHWRDEKSGTKKQGVKIKVRETEGVGLDQLVKGPGKEREEVFDEMIVACDADAALKILGKDASWMEKKVLGNVKYLWDVTTTHNDFDYMQKVPDVPTVSKCALTWGLGLAHSTIGCDTRTTWPRRSVRRPATQRRRSNSTLPKRALRRSTVRIRLARPGRR